MTKHAINERELCLDALTAALPCCTGEAYAKVKADIAHTLMHDGWPTVDEMAPYIGRNWYLSPTGRRLKDRGNDETPITPRQFYAAQWRALFDRFKLPPDPPPSEWGLVDFHVPTNQSQGSRSPCVPGAGAAAAPLSSTTA